MKPEEEWLLALADPEGPPSPLPGRRLNMPGVASLCLLANMHGVLPAVLWQVERLLRDEPAKLLADAKMVSEVSQAMGQVKNRLAQRSAMAMFLGAEAQRLVGEFAAAGADAIVLKGADFAVRLYAHSALRTYGDIDLLVRMSDEQAVAATMARLGYESREQSMKHAGWLFGAFLGTSGHARSHGRGSQQSGEFSHRPGAACPCGWRICRWNADRNGQLRATPAGLLIIAAVHAAASHGFEKVQHLCDIAQVVRGRAGPVDEKSLRESVAKTGAGLSLATALDLTARSLNEPACAQLLGRLELRWPRRIVRLLMTPAVVVRSQGAHRRVVTWRRRTLRQMLKSRR